MTSVEWWRCMHLNEIRGLEVYMASVYGLDWSCLWGFLRSVGLNEIWIGLIYECMWRGAGFVEFTKLWLAGFMGLRGCPYSWAQGCLLSIEKLRCGISGGSWMGPNMGFGWWTINEVMTIREREGREGEGWRTDSKWVFGQVGSEDEQMGIWTSVQQWALAQRWLKKKKKRELWIEKKSGADVMAGYQSWWWDRGWVFKVEKWSLG